MIYSQPKDGFYSVNTITPFLELRRTLLHWKIKGHNGIL